MCNSNIQNPEEKSLVYKKSTRKEIGTVVAIDINLKLMKEFFEARQLVEQGPIVVHAEASEEESKKMVELYEKRVKPFFDHMSEIFDSL